jgi:hypothetical protein
MQALGVVVLIAAGAMLAATFTPWVTQSCILCPALGAGTTFAFQPRSLFQGLDAWIVLSVVIALGLAATSYLRGLRRRLAVMASLVFSLCAVALGIFEGVDAGGRVVGWDAVGPPLELGVHGPVAYVPAATISPPVYLDAGFFTFVVAAAVAAIAAVALVAMIQRTIGRR